MAAAIAFAGALATGGEDDSTPASPATTGEGRAVFAQVGCGGCHHLTAAASNGQIGPDLDTALADHTRTSLRAQILDPGAGSGMPSNLGDRMSKAELNALVAFLLASPASP